MKPTKEQFDAMLHRYSEANIQNNIDPLVLNRNLAVLRDFYNSWDFLDQCPDYKPTQDTQELHNCEEIKKVMREERK